MIIAGQTKKNQEKIKKAAKKVVKKSSYFEDGYDFGDVTKTLLSTAADAGTNISKGFIGTTEGVADTLTTLFGDLTQKSAKGQATIWELFGNDDYANNLREAGGQVKKSAYENAKTDVTSSIFNSTDALNATKYILGDESAVYNKDKNWSQELSNKSAAGDITQSVEQGIGNIAAFAGLGYLTGGSTAGTFATSFTSAYGNSYTNALRNGLDEKEARGSAISSGLAEAISEQVFQGIPGVSQAGWADNLIGDSVKKYFGSSTGKLALKMFDSFGEGLEEVISNMLESTFEGIRKGENIEQIWQDAKNQSFFNNEQTRDAFISALISSAITNGGSNLISNQQKQQVLETYAKENNITTEEAQKVFDKIVEKKANLEDTEHFKDRVELEENIEKGLVKEIKDNNKNNQKIDLNELFNQTPNSKQEVQFSLDQDEFKNVKSDKQKVLANDMARLNNVKENHDLFKVVNAIQSANNTQQYHITTTEGLYEMGIVNKDENGNYTMPDGSPYVPRGLNYKNGEIYINADVGSQSGTQAVYHEMFEGFKKAAPEQYNEFKQMVTDIIGEENIQKEFDTYKSMYGEELTDDIRDEIINDKFGELAENQNFINKIADNRNVLEKFIDSIKNMIKYVKGTDEERQLMKLQKNLEKEFAKRYKETDFSQGEGDTAYSLTKASDTQREQALKLQKEGKTTEDIYLETGAYEGADGRWRTEIDDSGAKIKLETNGYEKPTGTFKLKDILDHPKLYKAYPEFKNVNVVISPVDGGYAGMVDSNGDILIDTSRINLNEQNINQLKELYRKLTDKNNMDNKILFSEKELQYQIDKVAKEIRDFDYKTYQQDLKSTLLHEIQHKIQHKEGFTSGTNLNETKSAHDRYIEHIRDINTDLSILYEDSGIGTQWVEENMPRVLSGEITIDQFFEEQKDARLNSPVGDLIKDKLEEKENYEYRYGVYDRDAYDLYQNTAGEIEAREVQKRMNYTPEERANEIPFTKDEKTVFNEPYYNRLNGIVKYSLTSNKDSQGRELSPQQQEYFKDSKVVDENGNLKVMYHGGTSEYNVFDKSKIGSKYDGYSRLGKGFYFTDSLKDAEFWATNGDTKSRNTKNIKEVYLNLTNPFDVNKDYSTELADLKNEYPNYIDDFNLRAGYRLIRQINAFSKDLGFDSTELLQRLGFDGVIGYDEVTVFEPNQIKNIDNTNPTSNEDIRYSLSPTGEMVDDKGDKVTFDLEEVETDIPINDDKKLMVLHNLGENKMNGIMDLDGIPVPSLAITNPYKVDHSGFGEATLIFKKDTINPANRLNEVYDRDVWSPTQPQIDYNIKSEDLWDIEKNIYNDYKDDIVSTAMNRYFDSGNLSDSVARRGIEGTIEDAKQSPELMYVYEKTINPNYQPVIKSKQFNDKYSNEMLQSFIDNYKGTEPLNELRIDDNVKEQFKKAVQPYYDNEMQKFLEKLKPEQRESGRKLMQESYEADMEKGINITDFLISAYRLQQEGLDAQTIDKYATLDAVKDNINQEEYNKWVDDTLGNLLRNAEKGIYNGKSYITETGRRTFKQTHDKYTLENLVKAITKGDTKGTQDTWAKGYGQIQAKMANQFESIEEIRNAENQIMSDEEAKAITQELHDAIDSDISDLADRLDGDYFNYDNAAELIFDYAGKKNRNEAVFRKLANDYANHGIPSELIERITNDLEQLKEMPTDYFEAKPQRAVGLDEIGIGLIPNTWSEETKQRMRDKGIKFIEYDKSIEGERQRLEKELTDFMFSLTSNQNIDSKEIAPVGSTVEETIAPIREDLSNITEQMNNLSNQIQTLQNELETRPQGYVETYKEQRNENIPTKLLTEEDANTLQDALMNDEGYLRSLDEEANLNPENTKLIDKLTNDVSGRLDLSKNQKDTLRNIIKESIENGYSTNEISDALYREFSETSYDVTNDEAIEVKKLLRDTPIKVSDAIKKDISDYGRWKQSNFGKIRFSNMGSPVDTAYAELSDMMPYYFPSDIVNPTDQLLRIAEVANMATKSTETMNIEPEYFDDIADYIKNTQLEDEYNAKMKGQYDIDKDIQFNMIEDIAPTTIRTQESIDDFIENRDIAPVREDATNKKSKSPISERLDTMKRRFGEMITNRNYEIDKTSKATGNRDIKFAGDMLNNVSGEVQYNINNKQTDMNGNVIGKSVSEIFAPSKKAGLYEVFNDYLYNKSNIERHRVGKGSQVPEAVSEQLVKQYEQQYPELQEWANDVYNYYDNVLQEQVDAGLITQKQYDNYRGEHGIYRSYTPFYAESTDTSRYFDSEGKVKPVSTLKRSKGNADDVNQLLSMEDAMAKQTYAYKRAIRQNELYKEIVSSLEKYSDAMDMDVRDEPSNLNDSLYVTPEGNKVLSAYINGEKTSALISDELFNELSGENEARIKQLEKDFSLITTPLQKVSSARRNILTSWNPTFLARNAIKDIQDAVINSKHTGDMLKNYFGAKKGQKSAVFELREGKTKEAQQFLALYGADNLYGDYSNVGQKKGLINKFARANELIELAPRFAEFKASLQNGESVQEAIYNAREVTTNFGRGGYITKALNNNGFTFLNANVQGLDKLVRNLSGENGVKGVTSVVVKGAAFAVLPSILNELLYGFGDDKDEDYEALPNYIKDNYYLIKTVNGNFVRIPKGRINAAFGSVARRTINALEGDENPYEGALSNAWDQIGVGDLGGNNILAPINQAFGSKNGEAWYGGDIVPTRLQDKPASEQTDAKIDAISNFIGKNLGVSPYKVNYVLDQYSGGFGDVLLPMITPETKSGAEKPHEYLLAPIKDAFVVNSTDDNKYAGEFYNTKDKLEIQYNSENATDEDILKYKYMSNISKQMSDLYKERREVQADTTIGNKEKYAKVQVIQNEINNLAKEALSNYNNFSNTGNYTNIDDVEYYKNSEGEWTKVKDEESEFTAGLNDAEKTAYYNVKNKISGITKDYTAKTKDLDKDDPKKAQYSTERKENITQAIVNSGLDNYTKAMVYSKYYSDKDAMTNAVNSGYDIDTYITALNDIGQLRDEYSKDNGYSTEERKQRTIAYINSLEMNIPQKAMMIRQYYSSFREYNNDIVDYVSNLNISYEDKKAILESTGMTVNGNNVSWK